VRPDRRRSFSFGGRGDESQARAGFCDRRWQQNLAHRHHGPLAATAGGGGLKDASVKIKNGTQILLDGYNGSVVINPCDQTLVRIRPDGAAQASIEEELRATLQSLEAITLDGQKITLSANIEQSGDVEAVKEFGADGVGLFRTEFCFLIGTLCRMRTSNTRLTGRWRRR
jgi:phosphoenolpyruvate synthase/pyruvate phosphate dikinase